MTEGDKTDAEFSDKWHLLC